MVGFGFLEISATTVVELMKDEVGWMVVVRLVGLSRPNSIPSSFMHESVCSVCLSDGLDGRGRKAFRGKE